MPRRRRAPCQQGSHRPAPGVGSWIAPMLNGRLTSPTVSSPRPDLNFGWPPRRVAVKSGRKAIAKRLALDGHEHSGRFVGLGKAAQRAEAMTDLASAFTKMSGHHITSVWGGTADMIRRVVDGEVFDLVIIPASNVDELIQQGWLQANSRRDFTRSAIGVATASGVATPDISSGSALRQTLLNTRRVLSLHR